MRRALGIRRCILYVLLAIVAGFVWRVEGGGGETKKDDAADRMYVVWDGVTGIAHQGVTCNPPNATSQLSIELCLPKTQSGLSIRLRIIDPDFQGMDRIECEPAVWKLLRKLPEEVFVNITMLLLPPDVV